MRWWSACGLSTRPYQRRPIKTSAYIYKETMAGDEEQRRSQEAATQPTQHHRADDVGPSTDAGPAATAQGGPAATAQGGPAATAQGRPAATARVPSTPSVIELVNSMQILYEESQRRLHQTEEELRLAHVKIDILEDRSPRTGRKRDHTNTEREREPKIRKRPSSGKDRESHL